LLSEINSLISVKFVFLGFSFELYQPYYSRPETISTPFLNYFCLHPKMNNRLLYIAFFIAVAVPYTTRANDPIEIVRSLDKVEFDGICNEPLWDKLAMVPMEMYRPNHGAMPTERSEIFLTFDEENLYVGARLFYENGANVTVTTKKRDGADGGSDNFGILLDTFNDNENALCFETNPSGLRSDFSISNDGQSEMNAMPFNRDWNTFWDVKTTHSETCWQIEMRVPLSSLRFQENNGEISMGLTIWRSIATKLEWNLFPLVTNEFGMFGIWKPSQAKKIVLKGLNRSNPLYLTPYALVKMETTNEMKPDHSAYEMKTENKITGGLDLKYSISSNVTLDLTFNTDFAQAEADDQVVNITRFSIFLPEKRQFFLERNSIFGIKTGYLDEIFYSRRIGLDEGEIIPIYGGVRLVGRSGKYDYGLLDMQTHAHEYINDDDSLVSLASTNFGVFRLRKQVFNPRSYAGGMVTSKVDAWGNYNINVAGDLIANPFRNDYVTLNYAQTFDSDHPVKSDFYNYGKFYLDWENRSSLGFLYKFQIARAGEYYNPEMGFEMLENYSRVFGSVGYGWVYNEEDKKLLSQQISLWSWQNKRNEDLSTDISISSLGHEIATKSGYRVMTSLMHNEEFLDEEFELSDDVFFPVGKYSYYTIEGNFSTPFNKLFTLRTQYVLGTYYDGKMITIGPAELTYRTSSNVNLILSYQYSQVDIPDRDQYFEAHLVRLKTELTFTTKLSLLMFFQYSSNDDFGVNNIRFRYNPKEGNDLYLVFNSGYNTDLLRETPNLPVIENNTVILKYTYTFILDKNRIH
jgi:hypothetical protein